MKAYNVIGKVSGSIVTEKRGLTFPDARELQIKWEQRGCGLIVDEQYQQVKLDRVEIEPVEVLWSRELEMADMQREWDWKADKEKEAKGA